MLHATTLQRYTCQLNSVVSHHKTQISSLKLVASGLYLV